MSERPFVVVALGSNLGDSRRTILAAFDRLEKLAADGFGRSSLWKSSPVDCPPDSPPFINAAVRFVPLPRETPESLLGKLQALETEFGRRKKVVFNEPRPLDLDLICFGSEVRNLSELTLPHPRAHLRRFVLEPFAEIAPDFVLPCWKLGVSETLASLPTDEIVERMAIGSASPGR